MSRPATDDDQAFLGRALASHQAWKRELARAVSEGRSPQIGEPCELGRWLAAAAPRLGDAPEFRQLVAVHDEFHEAAAGIERVLAAGNLAAAAAILDRGVYARRSTDIGAAITALRVRIAGEGASPVSPGGTPSAQGEGPRASATALDRHGSVTHAAGDQGEDGGG
jgi:hypothetical protein